jgi:putative redox protein
MANHERIVTVRETGAGTYTQEVKSGAHTLTTDEPVDVGGLDSGPNPYDMLLASLGSCTSMTVRMYANQKKWPLDRVTVKLTHRKETDPDGKKRDVITRDIMLEGALDEPQRQRLLEIANKCPIHRTLENKPEIISQLVDAPPAPATPPIKPPQP